MGINRGVFVVQDSINDAKFELWQKSLLKTDVSLIYAGKKDEGDEKLDLTALYKEFEIDPKTIDEVLIEPIRFSYIAERCMKSMTSQLKKSKPTDGLNALWAFSNAIQDISFYDEDPVQRLHKTFELFREYGHLAARLDLELLHGSFPSSETETLFESGRVRAYLLNQEVYIPVNYALYLEHRLRMYIIQSCVEYLVMPKSYQDEFDQFLSEVSYDSLSGNIRSGIEYLSKRCPNFRQYPRLWQLFTYMLGGFILTDHLDEEIGLLSTLSHVPPKEIGNCFSVYDILFPTASSWLREIGCTHIKRLNFMPAPLMGIGANFRRYYYSDDKEKKDPPFELLQSKVSQDYTYNNLKIWNRAAFGLLKTSADLTKS